MADKPKVKREHIFLYAPGNGRVEFGDYFIVSREYEIDEEFNLIKFYSGRTFGTDEGYELPPINQKYGESYHTSSCVLMGKVRN